MKVRTPGFLQIIRAPFLFAILVPLFIGTITSISITGKFNFIGFLFACFIGLSLHISTNVYNDIHDTRNRADNLESKKSAFSGGSGILVDFPYLEKKMLIIARLGIVFGFIGSFFMLFLVETFLWPYVIFVYLMSAFLSKYYTAEPFKFSYRGLGEIVVIFGFGNLAILLSSLGQNLGPHPIIMALMPLTGLMTLFLVWMGQIVDLPTDIKAGKMGLVSRIGKVKSYYVLVFIHLFSVFYAIVFGYFFVEPYWPIFLSFVPYLIYFPRIFKKIVKNPSRKNIIKISVDNFMLYFSFSIFLILGFFLSLFI